MGGLHGPGLRGTHALSADPPGGDSERGRGTACLCSRTSGASAGSVQKPAMTHPGTTWKLLLSRIWQLMRVGPQLCSPGTPKRSLPLWPPTRGCSGLPCGSVARFPARAPRENQAEAVLSLAPKAQGILSTMVTGGPDPRGWKRDAASQGKKCHRVGGAGCVVPSLWSPWPQFTSTHVQVHLAPLQGPGPRG